MGSIWYSPASCKRRPRLRKVTARIVLPWKLVDKNAHSTTDVIAGFLDRYLLLGRTHADCVAMLTAINPYHIVLLDPNEEATGFVFQQALQSYIEFAIHERTKSGIHQFTLGQMVDRLRQQWSLSTT